MSADTPPAALQQVRALRRSARAVVRATHRSVRDRCRALIELAEAARQAEAPGIAQGALWAEAEHFLRTGEPEPPPIWANDPVETAIRRQHRVGRVRCDSCLRLLPTAEQLDRDRARRIAELERRALFLAAVDA